MKVHRTHLKMRLGGTITGVGFMLIGLYALFGGGDDLSPLVRERAQSFGFTATVIGVIAVTMSWLSADLSGVWCRPPRTWRDFRGRRAENADGDAPNRS